MKTYLYYVGLTIISMVLTTGCTKNVVKTYDGKIIDNRIIHLPKGHELIGIDNRLILTKKADPDYVPTTKYLIDFLNISDTLWVYQEH